LATPNAGETRPDRPRPLPWGHPDPNRAALRPCGANVGLGAPSLGREPAPWTAPKP
jgi:hypothetical protein